MKNYYKYKIKEGTILIARKKYKLDNKSIALIKGKEYTVERVLPYQFAIKNEVLQDHYFVYDDLKKYFRIKELPVKITFDDSGTDFICEALGYIIKTDKNNQKYITHKGEKILLKNIIGFKKNKVLTSTDQNYGTRYTQTSKKISYSDMQELTQKINNLSASAKELRALRKQHYAERKQEKSAARKKLKNNLYSE